MDFNMTDERQMLKEMLERFLQTKYGHEARRQVLSSGQVYDHLLFEELAELGIISALFAEDRGGLGGAGADISVVFESLGKAGVIEPILPALLAGSLLATSLQHEDYQNLIDEVIGGSSVLSFAHGEPDSRYDLNQVTTEARADGNTIVLNGIKTHVINGAQSQMLVVSARETGEVIDEAGVSLFLLPLDTPGVSCVGHLNIDGTAAATIIFKDVQLNSMARITHDSSAYEAIERAVAHATLAVCAEAVGAMESAKQLTIDYLRERQQFGVPIGKFQALQHRMADLLIEIEQARSAVVNLAGNLDQPRLIRERYVSAAKNLIGRVGAMVSEECIQLHGGIGMTDEYALSHFARRLIMIDHQFGDVDYHLERFISFNGV